MLQEIFFYYSTHKVSRDFSTGNRKKSVLGSEQFHSEWQKFCSSYLEQKGILLMHRNSAHPLEVLLKFIADFWSFLFGLLCWNEQGLRSFAVKCTWIFSIHPHLCYPFGFFAACAVIPFIREHQFNSQQQNLQVDPPERPHAECGAAQCE